MILIYLTEIRLRSIDPDASRKLRRLGISVISILLYVLQRGFDIRPYLAGLLQMGESREARPSNLTCFEMPTRSSLVDIASHKRRNVTLRPTNT